MCPVTLPNEYDQGLTNRKAIYKKYPQAIPGSFAIQKTDPAPCRLACPAHLNVQGYVQMVAQGKYEQALGIIMENLPLPGVLGRICPRPCEEACRRCEVDDPVAVRDLKRLAADQLDPREIPIHCDPKRVEKVAVIGSGPAGLAVAYHLARKGILSTIFEALPEPGGMLRVGIPDYRLPREILDREIEVITRLGVEIRTNTALGRDVTIDGLLKEEYQAVYLAMGAHQGMDLGIPGEDAQGVCQGVDFLREVNLKGSVKVGKRIAVIGGGNVAIDVSRSALRLGAEAVMIFYRRTRAEMPAWAEEIEAAETEGVRITYLSAPREVLMEDGQVKGLRCMRMELGEPDASGRRRPVPVPGSEYDIEIDQLITAIGQRPDLFALEGINGLHFSGWGTIEVDPMTWETGRKGVFAGGDLQTGPGVAIEAIAAGREAAESIVRYLDGREMVKGRNVPDKKSEYRPVPQDQPPQSRAHMPTIPAEARIRDFSEVEAGYDPETGQREANRCLNCGYCCECYQCVTACKAGAVTLETHAQRPETLTIKTGAVILAPGFQPFDPAGHTAYAYGRHPNVVTGMEFERFLSASGPTQGRLVRPSDGKPPAKIAWIQCVGSRDVHACDHGYCSSVCCMYAIKEAIIAKEHAGSDLECALFYMDMRTHGKDFEHYYNQARDVHGVRFIRSRVPAIDWTKGEHTLVLPYVDESNQIVREPFDMVVLSVGMEAVTADLAGKFDLALTEGKFAETPTFSPVSSSREGVYVCGAFSGPKDIPQSVIDAGSAAAEAGALLSEARNSMTTEKQVPREHNVSGERPRIGVFVCHCGINIGGVVDVPEVRDYAASLPYVEYVADNMYTCSQDTQETITKAIQENRLNRVVVAACTPKTHEPLFQETLVEAGLNKYLFEMTNIRNQDSWVHKDHRVLATQKAEDLVRMAVAKVALMEPLEDFPLEINQRALIIGGGIAGMTAAKSLAQQGYGVCLMERGPALGGQARNLYRTWKGEDIQKNLHTLISTVEANPRIDIRLNTEICDAEGFVGNFRTTLNSGDGGRETIEHGVTLVATGAGESTPDEYLYGKDPRVLTHTQLDQRFLARDPALKQVQSAVFIQCVGSREPGRPYCSRVCCTHSIESALHLKEINPDMQVFILYRDIRTYGEREYLYRQARMAGILFIPFSVEQKPQVSATEDGLKISVMDRLLGEEVVITADLLSLASAIVPPGDETLSKFFKLPVNENGFFVEAHAKLGPSEFATDGVFLCGMAHYPKPIDESVAQALAASSRAVTLLSRESILMSGMVAHVNPSLCSGCGVCVEVCPYSAPSMMSEGPFAHTAEINPVLCKGCGLCTASCRSGAINLKGFGEDQIMAMIEQS